MVKKSLALALVLVLILGSVAIAAELSLVTDLDRNLATRAKIGNFFVELNLDNSLAFDTLGLGIIAQTESPFYGLVQINTDDALELESLEVGGGANIPILNNVDFGGEVTFSNPNIEDFKEMTLNLSVYLAVNFNLFPSPSE